MKEICKSAYTKIANYVGFIRERLNIQEFRYDLMSINFLNKS